MTEKEWVEEIKRHFDVVAESLESKIQTVAEGHDITIRKIEDSNKESEQQHNEIKSMLKFSYVELDNRVVSLEKRLAVLEKRNSYG